MMDSIMNLRKQIAARVLNVSKNPGYYTWWLDEEGMRQILSPLNGIDYSRIMKKLIGGKDYYALYFGISSNLNNRIKWHISQHHTQSSAKSGYLSTLRQTISALLGIDMTKSEQAVNKFMDDHCWLEFDNCASHVVAKQMEKNTLHNGYYPLNIQGNKGVDCKIGAQISGLRKEFKK